MRYDNRLVGSVVTDLGKAMTELGLEAELLDPQTRPEWSTRYRDRKAWVRMVGDRINDAPDYLTPARPEPCAQGNEQ